MSDYTTIQLNHNQETIVSVEDSDLAKLKWTSHYSKASKKYYANRVKDNKHIFLHIVILERILNRPLTKGELCDHIDLNPLNNQRNNLRIATYTQNQYNKEKQSNNTSGYKGVSYHKHNESWRAYIYIQKHQISLGYYNTALEAALAYDNAARKLHGEFARLNFPD